MNAQPFSAIEELINLPSCREQLSPFGSQPWLLADLGDLSPSIGSARLRLIAAQLRQLPCPTIAVIKKSGAIPDQLLQAFDVVIDDIAAAGSLIGNIRHNPIAAMTLVQLLRHSEQMDIHDGLLAESLAYATLQGGAEAKTFLSRYRESTPSNCSDTSFPAAPAVIIDRKGDLLLLTLNRPQQRNAYSIAMRDGLVEGLQLLSMDETITRAVIRGAGSCFCIGGDLAEFGTAPDTATAHAVRTVRNPGLLISQMAGRIECHLHRACIGSGIELPAFCQRITATENTFFQLPEITMGLIPGAGGTVSIPRRIGRQRMAWWALSAKRISAKTALEWGLIDGIGENPSPRSTSPLFYL